MLHSVTQMPASREQLTRSSKLLIIEDNRFERIILRQLLEDCGFVDIEEAENGVEGLDKIDKNIPDLIVLDIEMPEMDGLEFCRIIQNTPTLKYIPIIAQTGRTQSEDVEQIFDAGASDYVSKPIDKIEFIARIFSHLERMQWFAQATLFYNRVKDELAMASQTQRVLIPSDKLLARVKRNYNISVRHYGVTCSELGGDSWGVHALSDDKLILYIVDFSGHGVNAALNTFRLNTLMQQLFDQYDDPGQFLTKLNAKLAAILPTGQFATMFYGIVDIKNHILSYATAGCPTPLIFRENGATDIIDGSGYLFGTMTDICYDTRQVAFAPGDMLFLYSDALTEAPDKVDHLMTEQEIINCFKNQPGQGFELLLTTLQTQYDSSWPDDLTITGYYFDKNS